MDNNKQLFDKMVRVSGDFLNGEFLDAKDKETISNDFIDGFYKVLRVALDVSVDDQKFSQFVDSGKKDDPIETVRFLITTLDNEKTYTLMNYYLMNFLVAFGKGAQASKQSSVNEILSKENLVPQGFASVVDSYNKLTSA